MMIASSASKAAAFVTAIFTTTIAATVFAGLSLAPIIAVANPSASQPASSTPAPSAAPADAPAQTLLAPQTGEIALRGLVEAFDKNALTLIVSASSFTLPSGKSKEIAPVKVRTITLQRDTLILVNGEKRDFPTLEIPAQTPINIVGQDAGTQFRARAVELSLPNLKADLAPTVTTDAEHLRNISTKGLPNPLGENVFPKVSDSLVVSPDSIVREPSRTYIEKSFSIVLDVSTLDKERLQNFDDIVMLTPAGKKYMADPTAGIKIYLPPTIEGIQYITEMEILDSGKPFVGTLKRDDISGNFYFTAPFTGGREEFLGKKYEIKGHVILSRLKPEAFDNEESTTTVQPVNFKPGIPQDAVKGVSDPFLSTWQHFPQFSEFLKVAAEKDLLLSDAQKAEMSDLEKMKWLLSRFKSVVHYDYDSKYYPKQADYLENGTGNCTTQTMDIVPLSENLGIPAWSAGTLPAHVVPIFALKIDGKFEPYMPDITNANIPANPSGAILSRAQYTSMIGNLGSDLGTQFEGDYQKTGLSSPFAIVLQCQKKDGKMYSSMDIDPKFTLQDVPN